MTDSEPHAFGDACFYTVTFAAFDDDGGSASDTVKVIITGNESKDRSVGYWQTQYQPRPTALPEARRLCYLAIVGFMSTVFNEARDASTVAAAYDVMQLQQNGGSELQKLDRQLLAAWLNFANGAFDYTELFDTNNDKVAGYAVLGDHGDGRSGPAEPAVDRGAAPRAAAVARGAPEQLIPKPRAEGGVAPPSALLN